MKIRRFALMAVVLVASTVFAQSSSRGATNTAPAGLPMYQFVETGVQPLPWNAVSLKSQLNATSMLGGPHGATSGTIGVIAYRTNNSHLALFTQSVGGATRWIDFTPGNDVPTPAADPIPFFDPSNNVDLLYVDDRGHVIVLSPNDPNTTIWARLHHDTPWRPYVTTDLSALTGVLASNGLPSIQVTGTTGTVAYRTSNNTIEVLTLTFAAGQPIPVYSQNAFNVTNVSTTTSPTTTSSSTTTTTSPSTSATTTTKPPAPTTTKPVNATAFGSDPVVLPGATPTFAANLNNGDLAVYTNVGASIRSWTAQNLTALTGTPALAGSLALGTSAATIDVAALTSGGAVELFTTPYSSSPSSRVWNAQNVTSSAVGAPPLTGTLSVQVTPTQVAVAGQAANWGDLFVLTSVSGVSPWTSTDVSVTAGSAARSVGSIVTGLQINGQLTLYAAGLNSPPRQGVGVYAIPSAKWTTAVSDGWPIISETGGLGTRTAPWVGFTGAPSVATSPDFLLGQSIYNAHKRVTWLDFWTVSGPLAGQAMTTTNFYAHGFAAGAWVATQIDSYRALGVGLKPDWVIFDPEGYPDNHSGLDAPGGSSPATIAKYATYWSSMVQGWQAGLNSIDPSLNAGVYASQSEYRNYQLSTLSLPVFMAVAFGGGGPIPVPGASGSNVRGFISFDAVCTPTSTLQAEATTLLNPPWGGQFNTLQFNAGVYCPPPLT
ncbi:MAG: hypothetical protein ACYDB2_00925 [Acidimicrobiales bacterium]